MTLQVYGTPPSRTHRVLWAAHETGEGVVLSPVDFTVGDNLRPEYLAINPNGKVPAIRDGALVLWESLAITLYIADKAGAPFGPADLAERAQMTMWSFWALSELERDAQTIGLNTVWAGPGRSDPAALDRAKTRLARPLSILNEYLGRGRGNLVGGRFTVADLNVASVLDPARFAADFIGGFAEVDRWLGRCLARPAYQAAESG